MSGLLGTPLSKALALAAFGFGLATPLWFLAVAVPPEVRLMTFLVSAAVSSALVWLSLVYLAAYLFPRWPRGGRMLAALGLYFLIGVPFAFLVSWIRGLEGVQLHFWLDLEFGALVLLAWPFMVPFMVVFTPD